VIDVESQNAHKINNPQECSSIRQGRGIVGEVRESKKEEQFQILWEKILKAASRLNFTKVEGNYPKAASQPNFTKIVRKYPESRFLPEFSENCGKIS